MVVGSARDGILAQSPLAAVGRPLSTKVSLTTPTECDPAVCAPTGAAAATSAAAISATVATMAGALPLMPGNRNQFHYGLSRRQAPLSSGVTFRRWVPGK